MTKPGNKSKPTPADRLHAILGGMKNEGIPIDRLPKARLVDASSVSEAARLQSPPAAAPGPDGGKSKRQFLPALWTVASLISMGVNIILLLVLISALRSLGGLNLGQVGTGLAGGLYSNFERMDAAHIKTDIPVQSSLPLSLSIPVQTTTNISLAEAVEIPNAHVKISTGTFNIDSDADVTLPAGTNLNVVLNFSVPVQTTVPVALHIPVDIALDQTDLHPALAGLESTIKPLYCVLNPDAISINNSLICK
ncbi:MAG TPA: hypothetical protein VLZ89_17430 [Anaerolineales bacterium]|nr:hypothetical protein [Anaerolineales bacterium]